MATVYLNLGSNLGVREANLRKAVELLENSFGPCKESNMVETEPWGFVSANSFINMGVACESDLPPLEILEKIKKIEKEISEGSHRNDWGEYIDRVIDIDIMAIGNETIDFPELKIPHIFLADRYFFLKPFLELAPDWKHPVTHQSLREMLNKLVLSKDNA